LSPPFEPGYHETVRAVFAAEKSKEGAGGFCGASSSAGIQVGHWINDG